MNSKIKRARLRRDRLGAVNRTVLFVLAVVGTTGLLAVLVCAGCGFWAFKVFTTDIPAATEGAEAFLDDLKSDRLEAAYAKTSGGFQSAQTFERFRDFVDQFSTFKTHTTRTFGGGRVFQGTGGKQATIKMTLHSANNAMPCTLTLVPDDGQWKVLHLNVP